MSDAFDLLTSPSANADMASSSDLFQSQLLPPRPREEYGSAPPSPAPVEMDLSSSQTINDAPAAVAPRAAPAQAQGFGLASPPASSPSHYAAASTVAASPAAFAAAAVAPAPVASAAPVYLPLDLPAMRELPPIKLGRTPKERTLYEQLGDLYSLIVTTEHVEGSYVRDALSEEAYAAACSKLIAQYKTLRESMGSSAPDLEAFGREYGLECRAGENRLRVGVPATIVHGGNANAGAAGAGGNHMQVAVFHAVQHFITAMDSLKLNLRAVDELYPTLSELVESVNKVPSLPADHESRGKTVAWLTTLHNMKAHEEITEEQARQMSFDLDSAYNAFHRFVQGK